MRSLYQQQEKGKKKTYQQRVLQVERGSFTPLVFSVTGGMAPEATIFFKLVAAELAAKRNERYSCVMSWLRCRIGFSLLRSAIQSIRGSRSVFASVDAVTSFEAAAHAMHA